MLYICVTKANNMTLQDLKNNRERIIKNIKKQTSADNAIKEVMVKMIVWLNGREDIQEMKATMANIDKFTSMVTFSWIKYDFKPVITEEWLEKREQDKRQSHSTFF